MIFRPVCGRGNEASSRLTDPSPQWAVALWDYHYANLAFQQAMNKPMTIFISRVL